MGLPQFHNYYLASHLTRVIDWHCHGDTKDWVALESSLSPIPLKFSPWIPWQSHNQSMKQHPVMGATLCEFHTVTKKSNLTSPLSPLTTLKNNPDFTPGTENISLLTRDPMRQITVRDCFHNGRIKEISSFKSGLLGLPLWSYFQIRSFINEKTKKPFFYQRTDQVRISMF